MHACDLLWWILIYSIFTVHGQRVFHLVIVLYHIILLCNTQGKTLHDVYCSGYHMHTMGNLSRKAVLICIVSWSSGVLVNPYSDEAVHRGGGGGGIVTCRIHSLATTIQYLCDIITCYSYISVCNYTVTRLVVTLFVIMFTRLKPHSCNRLHHRFFSQSCLSIIA